MATSITMGFDGRRALSTTAGWWGGAGRRQPAFSMQRQHPSTSKFRFRAIPRKPVSLIAAWLLPAVIVLMRHGPALSTPRIPADWQPCENVASPGQNCKLKIPRIVHQTYKSEDLPVAWANSPAMWKETHPDWEYMFWTDSKNRALITDHYPWFLDQYDAYPNNIQRADSVRYFILYHYGGVYADMDVQPLRSIEPMLLNSVAMLSETPNIGLTNAFMSSVKGSDFFYYIMTQLTSHSHPPLGRISRHWEILQSTGPTFVWRIADIYAKLDRPNKEALDRVPAWVWGKCLICNKVCAPLEGAYFKHSVGDSWHNWDSYIITYGIFCHGEFILLAVSAAVLKRFNQVQITRIKGLAGFYAVALLLLLL